MNVRLLLGLLASGLLCGCAANTPYSETVVDTEKHTQQRGLPETPVYNRPVYAPGQSDQISLGSHYKLDSTEGVIASVALLYLRAKFAVADSGANFHLWPDRCDRTNNFTALVHRDAVSASQGCVRT